VIAVSLMAQSASIAKEMVGSEPSSPFGNARSKPLTYREPAVELNATSLAIVETDCLDVLEPLESSREVGR
jgi:hypothetical protein